MRTGSHMSSVSSAILNKILPRKLKNHSYTKEKNPYGLHLKQKKDKVPFGLGFLESTEGPEAVFSGLQFVQSFDPASFLTAMSETGDDCYFYYYSTCAKGDLCPFRHQPAALGCEITCTLWEKGRCFKKPCTFRHMVIENERNTIPCFWESQPMGCTNSNCSFLHLKPKQGGSLPPHVRPAMTSAGLPISSSNNQSIHAIGRAGPPNHPVGPMRPQGLRPSGPGRPPMYNRPGVPFNQGPYMGGQRPMGYEGFIPRGQPPMMMYQMQNHQHMGRLQYPGMQQAGMMSAMMMNRPRGNFLYDNDSRRRDDYNEESDDDYTSSDFSDVSISDNEDERKPRSKEYSRRRVRSPLSRREVKQRKSTRDKRTEAPRSSRENDKKYDRRKERTHQTDKDKSRSRDVDHNRSKTRKTIEGKDGNSERRKDVKSPEKEKSEKTDNSDSDIKVKTLEEILREKALKNLHERTAQKKKAQMQAEKNAKDGNDEERDDNSPEPIIKSVVSLNKTESTGTSTKLPESQDNNEAVYVSDVSDVKTKSVPEKKVQLRTAKTIIRSIIDPDNDSQTATSAVVTAPKKLVRKIIIDSDESINAEKQDVTEKTSSTEADRISSDSVAKPLLSDVSTIKVKSFDEIMKEKQKRKEQTSKNLDTKDKNLSNTETSTAVVNELVAAEERKTLDVKPIKGRKISVVAKKEEAPKSNIIKAAGKLLLRRKVENTKTTAAKKDNDASIKVTKQSKVDNKNTNNETQNSSNIVIKSFDEIMKEKRQRQKKQGQTQQEKSEEAKETTTVTRIKRPTIIRKKDTEKTETQSGEPRKFTSRKLKIVRQHGSLTKSSSSDNIKLSSKEAEVSSAPVSPSQPEPVSPLSLKDNDTTTMSDVPKSSPVEITNLSDIEARQPLSATPFSSLEAEDQSSARDAVSRAHDVLDEEKPKDEEEEQEEEEEDEEKPKDEEDDDDDESWQHEELPAVPIDTPTLESNTFLADSKSAPGETPKAASIFHIPGKTNLEDSFDRKTSPTKRPRSSLEELFGVPCDDEPQSQQNSNTVDKPDENDEEEISPAKRVKTFQETREEIVKAVNREMSKKDDDFDLDLDLEEEIANMSPGKHDDSHEGYNEDDLLLELDEMIND